MPPAERRTMTPARTIAAQLMFFDRARSAVERQMTLGAADLRLLSLLTSGPALTLREIGDVLDLEQSTVNRQVNRAIRAGLVDRSIPPGATAAVVSPTLRGRDRYERDVALVLALYDEALASLGDDSERFLQMFATFADAYAAAAGRGPQSSGGR